ncbi:hypothetical protein OG788_43800 [Streptomyces sp. NBC_00647]|uniref:hypothetical protein n=1 Tax=Streptomyces sp. NBC_00647 TaxID=2975796 RepID=UPI0032455255
MGQLGAEESDRFVTARWSASLVGRAPVDQLRDPPGVGDEINAVGERTLREAMPALLSARQRAAGVPRHTRTCPSSTSRKCWVSGGHSSFVQLSTSRKLTT